MSAQVWFRITSFKVRISAEVALQARRVTTAAVLGLALALGAGCAPNIAYQAGAEVPKARVAEIQRGKTTKYDLLESFGMPMVIAKKGETVLIPRGKEHSAIGPNPGGSVIPARFESASADTFFELFSDRTTGVQHRVYYFGHTVSTKRTLILLVYINSWTETRSDELWVLVNEQNGVVEDFVFRPGASGG